MKRKATTPKQEKFIEGVVRHGNATRAARDAGYAYPNVEGSRLLVNASILERVERRKAEAMRRAQIHTDVIVGSLAEIATCSLGDVLDELGEFSLEKARENGVDHLIKKLEKTVRYDKEGARTETYKFEMYSRLEALNQLRDNFGMKQEPRPNSYAEVESAVQDFLRVAAERGYQLSYDEAREFIEPRMASDAIQ